MSVGFKNKKTLTNNLNINIIFPIRPWHIIFLLLILVF